MQKYSFIEELSHQWMDMHPRMKLKLVGEHVNLLTPADAIVQFQRFGNEWSNSNVIRFKYTKRLRPNSNWPWPFRLSRTPRASVEGAELYAPNGELRFRMPFNTNSRYIWPGDTLRIDSGQIKIEISW